MKKMGLDLGKARIGIAFSDILGILASAYETYKTVSKEADLNYISSLINKFSVDEVVVGLPLTMNGEEQEMAQFVRNFTTELSKKTSIKIVLRDERLTSVEADEYLRNCNIKDWRKRKELIDQVSAVIILQSYLDEK